MKNFIDVTEKGNVDNFLVALNENSFLIYSPTSMKKTNFVNCQNIYCLSTNKITKDVENINQIMKNIPTNVEKIIAIGGGTAIDIGKFISSKLNKNLIAIPSMLSTNVYATDKVALLINNNKTTLLAKSPDKIFVDYNYLKKSSVFNLYGLADIFSIYTALYDWNLAKTYNNEDINLKIYEEAQDLLTDTIYFIKNNTYDNIINQIEQIYYIVGKAGLITNNYGSGRPESCSEHILAKEIEKNINIHHGISVSISIIIMSLIQQNSSKDIYDCLLKIKVLKDIKKYNITRNLLFNILKDLPVRKDRFSVVNLYNRDDDFINHILDEYEKVIRGYNYVNNK